MELKRGTVVRTLAGHDKELFMVVLSCMDRCALIADGKTRTVNSPKKKNVIHLAATETVLDEDEMKCDKRLREALKRFAEIEKTV